jgi:hypothetical protein
MEPKQHEVTVELTIRVRMVLGANTNTEDAVDSLAYDIYDGVGGDVLHNTELTSTNILADEKVRG